MSLDGKFEETVANRSRSIGPSAPPEVLEIVSRAARGKRRMRGLSLAGGAAASVIAVVAVSAVVIAQTGTAPATTPSPSATPSASVSASPSPSVEELIAAPHVGTGFPDAFVLTDAVLADAGPGWLMESYASLTDPYAESPVPPSPAAVYVVDPEGTRYLAYSMGPSQSDTGLTILSWREATGEAVLRGESWGTYEILDLATGVATPLLESDLGVSGGGDGNARLIMTSADGAELWRVWEAAGTRYVRWTADDGYTPAAIDRESRNDPSFIMPSDWDQSLAIRSDGRVALFEARDEPADSSSWEPDTLYAYDVSADEVHSFRFDRGADTPDYSECYFTKWKGADTVAYECWLSSNNLLAPNVLPGLPGLDGLTVKYVITAQHGLVGMTARVPFGKPTDPLLLMPVCSC